jgi:hypothetical protein
MVHATEQGQAPEEIQMFTRKTIIALAAVASLGVLALASDDASARGFGGGARMHTGGGSHIRHGGFRPMKSIGHHRPGLRPIYVHRGHHHHHRYWGWRRHYWAAPAVVTTGVAVGALATGPAWNRCTCLTKEYTPEGAVVFKDLCTKEMAMNPPAIAPTAFDPAQGPVVQGSLQPLQR